MGGSWLLVMAWAYGLAAFVHATGSSAESLRAPDECARCFAENERLTSRIEQLLVRVGQLEAELAAHDGQARHGALEEELDALNGNFVPDNENPMKRFARFCCLVPSLCRFRSACGRGHTGDASMPLLAVSAPSPIGHQGTHRGRDGSRRKSSAGTHALCTSSQRAPSSVKAHVRSMLRGQVETTSRPLLAARTKSWAPSPS